MLVGRGANPRSYLLLVGVMGLACSAPTSISGEPISEERPARSALTCPESMTLIANKFCIDRFEASLVDEQGTPHSPYRYLRAKKVIAQSVQGSIPQAHISMEQSDAACKRAGKRLCTTAQWVDACRGAHHPKRTYPYGNIEKRNACNTDQRGHPTMLLHNGVRKVDSFWLNDPRINRIGGTLAPAGAFPECRTPDGAMDMVGNLLEWTRGERPLLMGGHYLDAKENGDGCSYVTSAHGPEYYDFTTGFRCCAKPTAQDASPVEPALPSSPSAKPEAPSAQRHESGQTATGQHSSSDGDTSIPADPPGFRSFKNPAGKLPDVGPPPGYESAGAACPVDMQLVDGNRCPTAIQTCKGWVDEPGRPKRACGEFAEPSVCQGKPRSMRYCIDRYEFTPKGYTLPLVHVSWTEAQTMCGRMGKRLCHEAEWEFACEGEQALPYPYGYKRDGARCNHDRGSLFTRRGKLVDQRVPTESLDRCESPFGVFNLVGNVDEWTTRPSGTRPHRSILRGGWWLTGRSRCRAATSSHSEIYAGPQTGFRCCKAAR